MWARVWIGLGLALVIVLGAGVRLWQLHELGLRNDESFTLLYASQSWVNVLGLHGFYDFHPPGSFTLTKLVSVLVGDIDASRDVSLIAGVAALPVLFALGVKVLDRRAALVATALMAVHPVAIDYARIGRMYALVTLLVLVSYLALVSYRDSPRWTWACLYGASVLAAMYVDYSAVYALVPQLLPLALVVRARWPQARHLVVALAAAVVGYLPWLPQLLETSRLARSYSPRNRYLGASWERIGSTLTDGAGFPGFDIFSHWWIAGWDQGSLLRLVFAAGVLIVALAGLAVVWRRPFTAAVILSLVVGIPITTFSLSLTNPGWDIRTMTPVIAGLCLLLAVPVSSLVGSPQLLRSGVLACLAIALLWASALPCFYADEHRKLRYDDLTAALVMLNDQNLPILTYSTGGLDTVVLLAYADGALDHDEIITFVDGRLEMSSGMQRFVGKRPTRFDVRRMGIAPYFDPTTHPAFWFVTYRPHEDFALAFADAGYQRVVQGDFGKALLELWAMPPATIGAEVPLVGDWVPSGNGSVHAVLDIGPGLAIARLPTEGLLGTELVCLTALGDASGRGALILGDVPRNSQTIQIGAYCPEGTTRVRVTIERTLGTSPPNPHIFWLPLRQIPIASFVGASIGKG